MKLSISNIAWDVEEDEEVAALLRNHGVDMVDIAPTKYFADISNVSAAQVLAVKHWWAEQGFGFAGMQSLLFGTEGLNMFADLDVRSRMLKHLASVSRIGSLLGAPKLVFGSPRNRDCRGIAPNDILPRAVEFFHSLGEIANAEGVVFCLEPNPSSYGCNFMTTLAETEAVVRATSHAAIRLQLDTGALAINNESIAPSVERVQDIVGHIHLSEPQLVPLGDSDVSHNGVATTLNRYFKDMVATVEMVATKDEPHVSAIARALETATLYR